MSTGLHGKCFVCWASGLTGSEGRAGRGLINPLLSTQRSPRRAPPALWPWPLRQITLSCVCVCVWQRCCYTTLRGFKGRLGSGGGGSCWGDWGDQRWPTFDLSPFLWTQCHNHSCSIQQVWRLIFSSELQVCGLRRRWVSGHEEFWGSICSKIIISLQGL